MKKCNYEPFEMKSKSWFYGKTDVPSHHSVKVELYEIHTRRKYSKNSRRDQTCKEWFCEKVSSSHHYVQLAGIRCLSFRSYEVLDFETLQSYCEFHSRVTVESLKLKSLNPTRWTFILRL